MDYIFSENKVNTSTQTKLLQIKVKEVKKEIRK